MEGEVLKNCVVMHNRVVTTGCWFFSFFLKFKLMNIGGAGASFHVLNYRGSVINYAFSYGTTHHFQVVILNFYARSLFGISWLKRKWLPINASLLCTRVDSVIIGWTPLLLHPFRTRYKTLNGILSIWPRRCIFIWRILILFVAQLNILVHGFSHLTFM